MKKIKKCLWLPVIGLYMLLPVYTFAQSGRSATPAHTAVNFPNLISGNEENPLNTITTTGPDGTHYKLVQIGDRLPKLYVNSKLVPTENLNRYAALVDKLTPILWQRQKDAANQKQADDIRQQDAIINDLVKDQVVKSERNLISFRLTANELTVNGKAQSFAIFSRYLKKYIKDNDRVYQFNYSSK